MGVQGALDILVARDAIVDFSGMYVNVFVLHDSPMLSLSSFASYEVWHPENAVKSFMICHWYEARMKTIVS